MAFDCDRRGTTGYLVLRETGADFFLDAFFEAGFADLVDAVPLKI